MRKSLTAASCVLAVALAMSANPVSADVITTALWTPVGPVPQGTANGVLSGYGGPTINLGLTTTSFLNSGGNFFTPWGSTTGTTGISGAAQTSDNANVLGATAPNQTDTITFSSTLVNPYFLVAYADATSTINFGVPVRVVSTSNAQVNTTTGLITFVGATNNQNDGFAIQILGTYGPSRALSFTYGDTAGGNTVSFTVGTAAVPEPGQLALASCIGVFVLGSSLLRRRKLSA